MLQALREKTSGWIAFIILASVGVPFAFFGINNYFETQTESFVARVGKQEITPSSSASASSACARRRASSRARASTAATSTIPRSSARCWIA